MHRWLIASLVFAAPVTAQTCDGTALPCELSWVEAGEVQTARFTPHPIDFESDYVGQIDGVHVFRTSDRSPTLGDFDGDGRIDVGLFSLVGMVNGDYHLLRRSDARFVPWGVLNGDQFLLDESDLITAGGRSSCCARGIAVHDPSQPDLPIVFTLDVRPEDLSNTLPQCDLSAKGPDADIRRGHGPMIDAYCSFYEDEDAISARTAANLWTTSATVIDAATVFACTLDNGKSVRVDAAADTLSYRYGPPGAAAELTFTVPLAEADILPDNGAGSTRFSYAELPRDGYLYRVENGYSLLARADRVEAGNFYANLIVTSPAGDTLFERPCDLDTLFTALDRLPAR